MLLIVEQNGLLQELELLLVVVVCRLVVLAAHLVALLVLQEVQLNKTSENDELLLMLLLLFLVVNAKGTYLVRRCANTFAEHYLTQVLGGRAFLARRLAKVETIVVVIVVQL